MQVTVLSLGTEKNLRVGLVTKRLVITTLAPFRRISVLKQAEKVPFQSRFVTSDGLLVDFIFKSKYYFPQ